MSVNYKTKFQRTTQPTVFGINPVWQKIPNYRQKAFIRCSNSEYPNPLLTDDICFKKFGRCLKIKEILRNSYVQFIRNILNRYNFDQESLYRAANVAANIYNWIYYSDPVYNNLHPEEISDFIVYNTLKIVYKDREDIIEQIMDNMYCILNP